MEPNREPGVFDVMTAQEIEQSRLEEEEQLFESPQPDPRTEDEPISTLGLLSCFALFAGLAYISMLFMFIMVQLALCMIALFTWGKENPRSQRSCGFWEILKPAIYSVNVLSVFGVAIFLLILPIAWMCELLETRRRRYVAEWL